MTISWSAWAPIKGATSSAAVVRAVSDARAPWRIILSDGFSLQLSMVTVFNSQPAVIANQVPWHASAGLCADSVNTREGYPVQAAEADILSSCVALSHPHHAGRSPPVHRMRVANYRAAAPRPESSWQSRCSRPLPDGECRTLAFAVASLLLLLPSLAVSAQSAAPPRPLVTFELMTVPGFPRGVVHVAGPGGGMCIVNFACLTIHVDHRRKGANVFTIADDGVVVTVNDQGVRRFRPPRRRRIRRNVPARRQDSSHGDKGE